MQHPGIPDSNLAVIVCTHVARQGRPILCAVRDAPLDSIDSGWQVHCGNEDHSSPDTGVVWALDEVCTSDHSLIDILALPVGTIAERASERDEWRVRRQ